MNKDLIAACQMFLIPLSVLFTALGVAPTEGLKTGVSTIGAVVSAAWLWRIWVWDTLPEKDRYAAVVFAGVFLAASVVSFGVHSQAWYTGKVTSPQVQVKCQ